MDRNRPSLSAVAATLIAGLLLPAPAWAQAHTDVSPPPPNYPAQAFDVVVLRPVGLVVLGIGAALFVPVAVLTAPGGRDTLQEALEQFVLVPAEFVFKRPLGDF